MAYHSTNNRVTNIQTPTWDDFHNEDLGPKLPLSDEARKQGVSGVLPSGESNGLDLAQQGSGINRPFPYPNTNTPKRSHLATLGVSSQISLVMTGGLLLGL
jgi:hypothetical protein